MFLKKGFDFEHDASMKQEKLDKRAKALRDNLKRRKEQQKVASKTVAEQQGQPATITGSGEDERATGKAG